MMIKQRINFMSEEKINLYMNHLLVVYAFLLPISQRALSTIFILILILFLIRGNFKFYLENIIKNKIVQACIIFFLIHLLWSMGSDNVSFAKSVIDDMKYLLFPILFLSFLDKKFSMIILSSFVLGMLFSEVISYLIHFNLIPYTFEFFDIELYKAQSSDNPTPFLIHSRYNVILSIVIAIMFYNLITNFRNNKFLINFISIIFILSATYNISLIGGRIGYISFLVLFFITLIFSFKKNLSKIVVPFFIILCFLIYLGYNNKGMFQQRVDQTILSVEKIFSPEKDFNSSIGYRITFWINSLSVIKDNLLFGVGTGDHMDEVRKVAQNEESKKVLDYLSNPHNEYIKVLLQFGLIGFSIFIFIFYRIFSYNNYNNLIDKNILFIITIGIMIGIISSTFGSKVYLPLLMLMISIFSTNNEYIADNLCNINLKRILSYLSTALVLYLYAIIQ